MKVTINVDCTPEEARAFLGLPDVSGMQAEMMKKVSAQMEQAMRGMAPEDLAKLFSTSGTAAWADLQQTFWEEMTRIATGGSGKRS